MTNAVLLALVAIIPLVVLTLTSFVKISVVLSLVRNAIGAPDAPSGLVVTGLSLILTFFVMSPVAIEMVRAAGAPAAPTAPAPAPVPGQPPTPGDALRVLVPAEYQPQLDAAERGIGPLRAFLIKHSAEKDRATFRELGTKLGHEVQGDEVESGPGVAALAEDGGGRADDGGLGGPGALLLRALVFRHGKLRRRDSKSPRPQLRLRR